MLDLMNSDIWVGDWKEKFKAQNKAFSKQTAAQKAEENTYRANFSKFAMDQFKKFHPDENWDLYQGADYWINCYILQQRAGRKSLATQASAAAASAAAAQAAASQATAQKSAQAAQASKASAAAASKAAAAQAAAAQAAQKQAQAEKSAAAAAASKDSAAKAAAAAAQAANEAAKKNAEAQKAAEDWAIQKAKLEARIAQEQAAKQAAQEQAAQEQAAKEAAQEQAAQAQQVIYYSTDTGTASTAAYDNGENMDNNLTLQPVAVQGTNLRNSLLIVGGVAFVWWLLKRKKRGR